MSLASSQRERPAGLEGLAAFCVGQPDVVVVPVEAWRGDTPASSRLSDAGRALLGEAGFDDAFIVRFETAHSRYQVRATLLAQSTPRTWSAPRLGNTVLVRRGARIRPFMQPLPRASWVVEASDFDEETGSLDLAAYTFGHAERMGFVGDVVRAHLANVGWWLIESDGDGDFAAGARRSRRCDAAMFRAVADAVPWLRTLWEPSLRPPPDDPESYAHLPDTEILVPPNLEASVRELSFTLQEAAREAARAVRTEQRAAPPGNVPKRDRPGEKLVEWLRKERPRLLVTSPRGEIVWEPDAAGHLGPLRNAIDKAPARAIASLHEDLQVVDARSRAFLARVIDRAALPRSSAAVDPDGGVWIDPKRQLISYALAQPGLVPTEEPAPPFHRWLLGARVGHEWAHLVESAGWVAIPASREAEHEAALGALGAAFDAIVGSAAPQHRQIALAEAHLLGRGDAESVGAAFARKTMERVGDYRANLVAKEILPPEELEAYARVNAKTHANAKLGPFAQLMRHAIEVQYLVLAYGPDPYDYLFRSTFFDVHFVAAGVVDRARAVAVFEATRAVLACWEIDCARFSTG